MLILAWVTLALAADPVPAGGITIPPQWVEMITGLAGPVTVPAALVICTRILAAHIPRACEVISNGVALFREVLDYIKEGGSLPIRVQVAYDDRVSQRGERQGRRAGDDGTDTPRTSFPRREG